MEQHPSTGLFTPKDVATQQAEQRAATWHATRRVRRRRLFRWAGWSGAALVFGQWSVGLLAFLWPKRVEAAERTVEAGAVDEYQVGEVRAVREGNFYVVRVPEGFLALSWKCPHLGCTVPWRADHAAEGGPPGAGDLAFTTTGRFNCPCHYSVYNRYGHNMSGPATRPMDRYPLRVEQGQLLVTVGPRMAIQREQASTSDVTPP